MSQVQKIDNPSTAVAPMDMADSLLSVIERAARDPSVDIDKMERLIEMQERVQARHAKVAFAEALAELQPKLPVISERGKILNSSKQVQSTYAYWEDVNEAIRPVLYDHGFALSFKTGRSNQNITVTGILSHRLGHSEETTIELPADGSGSKNAVQAVASSTSYGKRYTAFALLNITSKGEDDDGATASYKTAEGSPMPRAKLEGTHSCKSGLKKAIHELTTAVLKCQDIASLDALLKANKPTIAQAEQDWPALLNGRPDIEEDYGLKGVVAQRRQQLTNSPASILINQLKDECATVQEMGIWWTTNEDAITQLEDADRDRFDTAYMDYESALQTASLTRAG